METADLSWLRILFWILCGLIVYAYAGYPIVIGTMARIAGRSYRRDDAHTPLVSIVIPAYNEQNVIARKLDNTLALDYPAGLAEVLVASESDDGTDAAVAGYEARGVRLLSSATRRGKVPNLHRAVPHTRGEILVFTDANAMLPGSALRKLVRGFADPRVGAVSGRLILGGTGGASSGRGEEAYWDFEMMIRRASSALGSLPGANGSLFALRRELYRPISETRGDDFELPIRVILQGRASILEPEAISREESSGSLRDDFRRKVRIINWMVVSALILLGEAVRGGRWLIAFQLLSHKLNRWAVPIWLAALLPVSLALAPTGSTYLAAALLQAGMYLLALAGLLADRAGLALPLPLLLPLYFVTVNAASLVGILTRAAGRDVAWHKRADPSL